MNPMIAAVLKFFTYDFTPNVKGAEILWAFLELAESVAAIDAGPETTVALRKLLEARDAAMRAVSVAT